MHCCWVHIAAPYWGLGCVRRCCVHTVEQVKFALLYDIALLLCALLYHTVGSTGSVRWCRANIVVPYEVAGFCALMLDSTVTLGRGLPGVVRERMVA